MIGPIGSITLPARTGTRALATRQVRVSGNPHPFKAERVDRWLPVGVSVQDCLEAVGVTYHTGVSVWLEGNPLAPEHWSRVRPKAATHMQFRVLPTGGIGRALGFLAIAAAALVASAFIPPLIPGLVAGTSAFALVGAGAGLAVGIVGSLLLNALIPVRPPRLQAASGGNPAVTGGGRPEASPTFSLSAPRNELRPWGPVPVVLGRHRVTPPYAAEPYTEIIDNEQYVVGAFVWGYGPLKIEDVKLKETPIGQFAEVQIEHREGWVTDPPLTLVTRPVFEDALSIQLLAENGFQQRTTVRDIDEFSLDFILPAGLAQLSQDGGLLWASVNIQADYRRVGDSAWTPLIVPGAEQTIGSGTFTISEAWEGSPGASDPGSRNARIWLNTSTMTLEKVETGLLSLGAQDTPAVPGHARSICRIYLSGSTITRIAQELHSDLMGFAITNPQDRDVAVAQGYYFSTVATFEEDTQTAIRRTLATTSVSRGQYEIRVKRVTPDTSEPSLINTVVWATIRSARNVSLLNFEKPLALTAIRIRASNQLNGPLDELNGVVTSILNHWDGSAWVTEPTQSPEAMFRAILQGPATAVPIPDSEIDLATLQTWADYCASKGFRFNMVRDFRASNWEALLDVCSAGRSSLAMDEWQLKPVIDEAAAYTPPVQSFTPRNSWDFRSERPYRTMPHAFRLRFLDEDNGWRQAETFAYADGYSASNATLFEQLEIPGQTDETTMIKQGRFHLAQAILRPETYSFSTDWENLRCTRGDRIRVTHDVPLWGLASGRITAIDGTTITLDEPVLMQLGRAYVIRFRLGNMNSGLANVATVAYETQTITVASVPSGVAVGDLWQFGELNRESASLIVTRIERSEHLSARLYCVDESPAIHTADSGPIAPYDPGISLPFSFRLVDNGEFEEAGGWVMDDPVNQLIRSVPAQVRHGRYALEIRSGGTGDWARPNGNLPKAINPAQHVYVEAWAKGQFSGEYVEPGYVAVGYYEAEGGTPHAELAVGWYTSGYYLFHAAIGQQLICGSDYARFRVDQVPPSGAAFVHPQLRVTGTFTGIVRVDDVLGFQYTLPVVSTSTLSLTNNYLRMQDQSGGIWHVSVIAGSLAVDDQLTIGDQANTGETWAWIERTSPDLTTWYLYLDTDGTWLTTDTQPSVGTGSAAVVGLLDKHDFRTWDLAVEDPGITDLVEA